MLNTPTIIIDRDVALAAAARHLRVNNTIIVPDATTARDVIDQFDEDSDFFKRIVVKESKPVVMPF